MKNTLLFKLVSFALFIFCSMSAQSQNVAITDDDSYTANSSAMLDIKSLSKGMLVPRLTTVQRNAVSNPATGLLVFDTDVLSFYFYNGTSWTNLSSGNASGIIGYTAPDKVYLNDINDKFGIGTISPNGKLDVKSDVSIGNEKPIFNVVNSTGDTVFAVYEQGVRINVYDDPLAKATSSKGGFAVGGFSPAKAGVTNEYLRITPDSIRLYVEDDPLAKANTSKGGFAVGGFSPAKAGFTNEYLRITPDSVRIYIEEGSVDKANTSKGGFAVGGFSPAKAGLTNEYLRITNDSTRIYTTDTTKGFGVQNIGASSKSSYMQLTPKNYLIGHQAGNALSSNIANTGKYNTFLGYEAGYNNTIGNKNYFIGYRSGYKNIDGYSNIFIGDSAGLSNTTGNRNVFIGNQSGINNTIGNFNVFLGYEAGTSNTSGQWNTFIGYQAGRTNATSGYNVFIGYNAGFSNTGGNWNVFVGRDAGKSNVGGFSNVFIGDQAGQSNIDGPYNMFIGGRAGRDNTSGYNNIFIGERCGQPNTTGSNNLFMGTWTGGSNSIGSQNLFLGVSAGYSNVSGTGNVFLGYEAGHDETGSNKLYIANSSTNPPLIYGDFASGFIGLGTTNPFCGIDVEKASNGATFGKFGNCNPLYLIGCNPNIGFNTYWGGTGWKFGKGSSNQYAGIFSVDPTTGTIGFITTNAGNADATCTTTERLTILQNGNVGIGNSSPTAQLDITGTNATGIKYIKTGSKDARITVGDPTKSWSISSGWSVAGDFSIVEEGVAGDRLYIKQGGNIGVGTVTPAQKLSVNGNICYVGSIGACSDIRYKKNVTNLNNSLSNILQLQGVNYYWKTDEFPENNFTKEKQIGFIAQDIEKFYPEVILTDNNGYKSVDYSRLTPILVEAIKEQQQQIETLNLKNAQLQNDNIILKDKVKEVDNIKAEVEKIKSLLNFDSLNK